MPQEEKKPMETAGKIRAGGKVQPREDVVIVSTGNQKGEGDNAVINHLGKKGTKHTVHAVLAHKLIEKGFATSDAPTSEKKKEADAKLTANELKKLETRLGHKPSDDEIAEAIKLKMEGGES